MKAKKIFKQHCGPFVWSLPKGSSVWEVNSQQLTHPVCNKPQWPRRDDNSVAEVRLQPVERHKRGGGAVIGAAVAQRQWPFINDFLQCNNIHLHEWLLYKCPFGINIKTFTIWNDYIRTLTYHAFPLSVENFATHILYWISPTSFWF